MLTIQVDGQLEQRLKQAAANRGAAPQAIAQQLLDESLPKSNAATLAILAEWESRNATSEPAELRRRQEEGETLMEGLDRNRTQAEGTAARKLWS
jgi:predicted transcriptional regulator